MGHTQCGSSLEINRRPCCWHLAPSFAPELPKDTGGQKQTSSFCPGQSNSHWGIQLSPPLLPGDCRKKSPTLTSFSVELKPLFCRSGSKTIQVIQKPASSPSFAPRNINRKTLWSLAFIRTMCIPFLPVAGFNPPKNMIQIQFMRDHHPKYMVKNKNKPKEYPQQPRNRNSYQTRNEWSMFISSRIVKLASRIVKFAARIVQLVLWNLKFGLWNLWGSDCETGVVKLWRRIVKLGGRIVKLGLWNSEDKLWNSGGRVWNWYCDSLRRDGETLGGGCFTGTAKLWRQIRKLWNSKFHNQSLKSQNATSKFHNLTFKNHYKSSNSLPCCSSSLAPFFSSLRPNSFPQLQDASRQGLHSRLNLVEAPSQFEVPWGGNFVKFHGGGNFDIILTLWRLQVSFKFHGGGNLDNVFTLCTLQVNLKFHGGGNFDIILTLWRLRVSLKFHGVGILISSSPCGRSESVWSSMGVGILISFSPCGDSKSVWSSMGVGILISSSPCGRSESIWSSMGVGILISS